MYTKKIAKYGNSHAIIIPYVIMEQLDWQKADTIIFTVEFPDRVVLRRLTDKRLQQFLIDLDNPIQI